jgi:molybdopterin/thiamine biosynthesis adenylyltransferase
MQDRALITAIHAAAPARTQTDGAAYASIAAARVRDLSQAFGLSGCEVEISALENGVVPERYARNLNTLSLDEQATLLKAGVAVVGLGGLGGTVVEILARLGIGSLTLIDGDRFEESNLNRQLLSTMDRLGMPKAQAGAERVQQINPSVSTRVHGLFLTADNALQLLAGSAVVVDCLDNLPTRFDLQTACRQLNLPLVSAAVAGASGQLTVIFPEDQGLAAIYGDPSGLPATGVEAVLGNLPHTVTLLASLQCTEVVKILLGKDNVLRNRLLLVDLTDLTFAIMRLQ